MISTANPLARLDAILEEGAPIAARHSPESGALLAELREKLTTGKLQIMAFGAYNAGKSTMINAMLGSEAAEVGDIPTTDALRPYDWEGHVLLDAPGVNAPIAHEKISRAQLERADLIFFILRQEDQDAADVVGRLMDLIAAKRPLFILLNGERSDPEAVRTMRERLFDVLLREARKRDLEPEALERLPVVFLNARTACKARVEGKPLLLEASGYEDFRLRFMEWLREREEETSRLSNIRSAFHRLWFAPVLAALEARASAPSELRDLDAEIRRIRRESLTLERLCGGRIRQSLAARRGEIGALIELEAGEAQISAGLERVARAVLDDMKLWLASEGVAAAVRSEGISGFPAAQARRRPEEEPSAAEDLRSLADFSGRLVDLWPRFAGFAPGRSASWGLSGFIGRNANVAMSLAGVVFEVFAAQEAEERHNRRARQQALRRHQWIEEASLQIGALLTRSLAETLAAERNLRLAPLEAARAEALRSAEAHERDLAEWKRLTARFEEEVR